MWSTRWCGTRLLVRVAGVGSCAGHDRARPLDVGNVVRRLLGLLVLIVLGSASACVDLNPPRVSGEDNAGGKGHVPEPSDAAVSEAAVSREAGWISGDGPPGTLGPDGPGADRPRAPPPPPADGAVPGTALDAPLPAPGSPCTTGTQCLSGFCTDGVCCDSACTGACRTCKQAGSVGRCTFVPSGEDVDGDCAAELPASCGRDGSCNGAGACRLYAAGTPCAPATCTDGTESAPRTCDGAGTCRPAATKSCEPYTCAANVCATSCTSSVQCISSSFCNADTMTCAGLKPAGAACQRANECLSRFCTDGVCCQTACTELCRSCNLAGSAGICTPIRAGEDPDDECPTDPATSCGRDGSCDGQGACRMHPAGTLCVSQSCSGSTLSLARTCDGAGVCQPATTMACPYGCAGTGCAASPPPSAPTGLMAMAGDAQVSLTWSSAATAASYTVKRSTTSGGPYTTVAAGVTATSYMDTTGLTNGTTYYYVVSAVSAAGESGNSNQVSATPQPPVSVPTSGLMLWLKADVGVTASASKVSQWADQSGGNRHAVQTTAANQPALVPNAVKGLPAVSFDGTDDFMSFTLAVNGLTAMTIALVSACDLNINGGTWGVERAPVYWEQTGEWGSVHLSPFQTNVKFRFGTGQLSNLPSYARPVSIGNAFSLSISVKNGTTDSLFVAGTQVASQSGKLSTINYTSNTGWLGRGRPNTTYFPGKIAELLVYNRALTDTERKQVEQYLNGRFF
jgi:hypothetical protein